MKLICTVNGSMGLRIIIYLNNKHISYMESNELLASLAKMEASLNEVESARKQVESTVNASSELQKEVREYVSAVKALCVSLQSWASDLRAREGALSREYEEAITHIGSTCTEVIRSFETEVEKTSKDFKVQTEHVIERFTEHIGKLDKHVQELNALKDETKKATSEIRTVKESLSQISKNLKESQESQDVVLNDVNQKSDAIIGKTDGIAEKIDSLQGKVDNISSQLSKIGSLSYEIKTSCEKINSTFMSSIESLLKILETSKNETAKNININRWIIIAAFIILLIIHFIK